MTEKDSNTTAAPTKTLDETAALSALAAALAPLDQAARIRLLRTISTFFELPFEEVRSGSAHLHRGIGAEPTSPERKASGSPTFSEDRSLSPKAFLIEKRPQSDVERIACLAYYLTHYREEPTFKTLDLSKLNTEAAQIKLSNATRAVDNAAAAHFLIPAGQGKKQLSAIGELYVQALPDRSAAREAIADLKKKRSRSRPKQNGSEEENIASNSSAELAEGEADGEP